MTVDQGSSTSSTISVASLNGFDLATGIGATVAGSGASGLIATLSPSLVTPSPGGMAKSVLTINASSTTPTGTYSVRISASGGTRSHAITVSVTVTTTDFSIAAPSYPLEVQQGSLNTTLVTFTSVGSFSGNVSLYASAPFGGLSVTGSPSSVQLTPGASVVSTVVVYAVASTPLGSYPVTVVGVSGYISHSLSILVTVVQSSMFVGREALVLELSVFNTGYNATLNIRNTGSASVTLVTYYVKDSSGDQYFRSNWSTGPNPQATSIAPNALDQAIVLIGTGGTGQCGTSCTLTATPFTFNGSPSSYTVVIVTARNNQFSFTI